ncbi:DUF177 domain-containing protein [Lactobacillus sp. ESL0228]|uniref:DUF177 domain-containing protein n=1 Tax=Lactobacillus sp. ESL0228 TaxID=2069352 RepID=UPI000EFBDA57|nr:YceD family protein [Lactobacillus sp. ESL0228]RMC49083.1 DUF177 domain-containing protein [Lactobacillus sp. ESL0228]
MLSLNFSQIVKSTEPLIHLEQNVEMRPEFLKRSQKLLYQIENVKISGDLFYSEPYVTGDFTVTADLIVPSSRSLAPVELHEQFHFCENYTEKDVSKEELDETEIPIVKVENDLIDLQTAIEDNILLHIPTTILTKQEKEKEIYPHGNGWSVISEEEYNRNKSNQINPAFAKLKDLFKQEDCNDNK